VRALAFFVVGGAVGCGMLWGCASGNISSGVGGADTTGPTTVGVGASGPSPTTTGGGGESSGPTGTSGGPATTGAGSSGAGVSSSAAGTSAASSAGAGSGGAGGGGPYDTPVMCSSNTYYVVGNDASMQPGKACETCHVLLGAATGHTFDVSGTVYPTAHEPDECNGANVTGAQVIITDGNGMDFPLSVNSVGNFYHDDLLGFVAFKLPLKARVTYNGKTRAMLSSLPTTGDCNSCHTESGAMNAPGRIMLP
jgi:hypothetical protein